MYTHNKYHAKKVALDGYIFDSIAESRFYECIMARLTAGTKLLVHPSFIVIPKQLIGSKTYRQAVYTPDFVTVRDGIVDAYDVKGAPKIKADAILRMKLFMQIYKAPVIICRYDYRKHIFEERQL